jgi:hypothetical protein
MERIGNIKEDFRSYLKHFKGIQGIGLIYEEDAKCRFVVNVYEKWYSDNKKKMPERFEGISIELRKVSNPTFLRFIRI